MKNNNEFLEEYTQIPDKQAIRKFIWTLVILVNVFNYGGLSYYQDSVLNMSIPNSILTLLIAIISIFDLGSLIFYIFPKQLDKITWLYTAIAFTGTSIFNFFISSLVFLHELNIPMSYLIVVISLLIYILVITAIIFNIKNKFKNVYNKKHVNKVFVGIFSSLCISLGIILSKQTEFNNIGFAISQLVMAYLLILPCSGFHKFYLIIKNKDKYNNHELSSNPLKK